MFDHDTSICPMDFEASFLCPCSLFRHSDLVLFMEPSALRARSDGNPFDVGICAWGPFRPVDRAHVQRASFAHLADADAEIRKTVLEGQRETALRSHEYVGSWDEHRRLRVL